MKSKILLIIFCTFFLLSASIKSWAQAANEQDSLELLDIYESTKSYFFTGIGGEVWEKQGPDGWGWYLDIPIKSCTGVTVDSLGFVTSLVLSGLNGSLPPTFGVGNLSHLQKLVINGTVWPDPLYLHFQHFFYLQGAIPPGIGNITALQWIDLSTNSLSDTIPGSLGNLANLQYLNLSSNNLTGTFPADTGGLKSLQTLNLSNNALNSMPSSIGQLQQLTDVNLSYNKLSDSIPSSIGKLQQLVSLNLASNQLTGVIPSSIGNLQQLNYLDLSSNQLSDSIPAFIGNLQQLGFLNLSSNKLSSGIPSSIGNLEQLSHLDLSANQLGDSIPASIGNIQQLGFLNLASNHLRGTIPASLGDNVNITNLLGLANNYFTFNGMELLVQKHNAAIYAPQHGIRLHSYTNSIGVSAGGTLSNNTYKWYNGAVLDTIITGDSTFTPSGNGLYWVAVTNAIATKLTLRSDTLNITTLPVNLVNFAGSVIKNDVVLNWLTTQEVNTGGYTVERSLTGRDYTAVGRVSAAGNSTLPQSYKLTDYNVSLLSTTTLYYRLKITDKNGSSTYSKVIAVNMGGAIGALQVYPNPAKNTAIIIFTAAVPGKYTVAITDFVGKTVKRVEGVSTIGTNKVTVNVQGYSQGTYHITVTGNNLTSQTVLLLKL